MSLSPIGSAVVELLTHKHTDRQTSYYFIVRMSQKSIHIIQEIGEMIFLLRRIGITMSTRGLCQILKYLLPVELHHQSSLP